MKKIKTYTILSLLCFICFSSFAQEKEFKEAMKKERNNQGYYHVDFKNTAYSMKQLEKLARKKGYLYANPVDTTVVQYGSFFDGIVAIDFVPPQIDDSVYNQPQPTLRQRYIGFNVSLLSLAEKNDKENTSEPYIPRHDSNTLGAQATIYYEHGMGKLGNFILGTELGLFTSSHSKNEQPTKGFLFLLKAGFCEKIGHSDRILTGLYLNLGMYSGLGFYGCGELKIKYFVSSRIAADASLRYGMFHNSYKGFNLGLGLSISL